MPSEYAGRGDPARSLALLWRSPTAAGRQGRAGLSIESIVEGATQLADQDGLDALSMRRLADHLGVGTTTLYTYVPGKAELIDVMLDTAWGETLPLSDHRNQGWRARLEHVAHKDFALYRRHPWMLDVASTRPALGPNTMARYEHALRAVSDIGLTDLEMDSVVSLVTGHVEGAARRAIEEAEAERRTGMSEEQWWGAHAPILRTMVDARRFPTASRVGTAAGEEYRGAHDAERAFTFGLARVLDGVELFVRSRADPSDTG